MKAGELHDGVIKMPEPSNKELSSSLTALDENKEDSNSLVDPKSKDGRETTPYQKLLNNLQFDSKLQWELALGKRVGFYSLRGELGCGNFSRVKAGVHALTKEKVAIKILDKKKMDKKTRRLLCREISSMEKLHHPNIVHLFEVIHSDTRLHLVMEYASGGELFTKLSTQGKMNEADAKIIFAQIVSAVQHMHQHNIIHRDLKAENVFYSEKKLVKVGDFGFSTEATSIRQALNTFCGSPPYAAPELFRDSFYFGESVDIWAIGIMLYFSVTGTMPFRAETVGKLKKRILSGEYSIPMHVSSACKYLIRSILKPIPAERFSITDITSSDWLANVVYPKPMGYFRLEPTKIDVNHCFPEEAYALCNMEKLGLGQEQLKKFHFPNGSSQSPFSWDSKLDNSNNQASSRRTFFNGGRSSHGNVQEQIEINENSALVGTYRILLLRAHKRLSGPSGDEETRRLRAFLAQSNTRLSCQDVKMSRLSCSHCEFNADLSASSMPLNELQLQNGTGSNVISTAHTTPDSSATRTRSGDTTALSRGQNANSTTQKRISRTGKTKNSVVRSKFCVIL